MKIAKFSVDNSLFVNLLSGIILVWGLMMFFSQPREVFPNVNYHIVTINTFYPGSAPQEVEKLISIPLEDEIRDVDGIDEIHSVSMEGRSTIVIQLDLNLKNTFRAVNDIQRAVDRVNDLPMEAEDPVVEELKTMDEPIIIISMAGLDIWSLRTQVRTLEDRLEDIPGIARADKSEWPETEIWVEVDPEKLKEFHLSLNEVARALKTRNINLPGGKIFLDGTQHIVRTVGEFNSPEEIEEVVIRANDQGNWLTVGDVATARYALEETDRLEKTNGLYAANLVVVKKQGFDALRVAKRVEEEVESFRRSAPPELQVTLIEDLPLKYLRRRLSILFNNASVGLLFVLCVLFMFLGRRTSILTALGIPLAFCLTAIFLPWWGITINLLSLFALIIALGMIVDDAIVVAENSYRYIERGMPPAEAAVRGTSEVARPVTATIATTVVAFAPLMFMSGLIGKFVWVIPAVVITALLASLFESLVILPSHIADFAKPYKVKTDALYTPRKKNRFLKPMRRFYLKILKFSLRRRWLGMLALAALMAFTLFIASAFMKFTLFPTRGVETFFLRAEAPTGTSLEETERRMRVVEEAIAELPPTELKHYITTIGGHEETRAGDPSRRNGTHLAQVQVFMTSATRARRSSQAIIEELREKIGEPEGLEINFEEMQAGPPVGKPVEIQLRGDNYDTLEEITEQFKETLAGIPGVRDIRDNYEPGKPELRVTVDERAARRGRVAIEDAARTLRYAYEGSPATSIKRTDEEVDVLVRFPASSRHRPETIEDLVVENDRGDLIPIRRVARFSQEPGVSAITHFDYKRSILVTGSIDESITTTGEVHKALEEKFADLSERYPGYSVKYGGQQEETQESLQNLFRAFGIALLCIYSILAVTFNSLLHPFVVIAAIPFGIVGIVWGFFFHGMPLSFMALLGGVGLCGVVVNDSIILVDFINRRRRAGAGTFRAILQAGKLRFRPVLLTTITTVAGLAPVAYGIGGLDVFLQPAAMAIVWGLIFATVLTLLIIPCMYAIDADWRRWVRDFKDRAKKSAPAKLT